MPISIYELEGKTFPLVNDSSHYSEVRKAPRRELAQFTAWQSHIASIDVQGSNIGFAAELHYSRDRRSRVLAPFNTDLEYPISPEDFNRNRRINKLAVEAQKYSQWVGRPHDLVDLRVHSGNYSNSYTHNLIYQRLKVLIDTPNGVYVGKINPPSGGSGVPFMARSYLPLECPPLASVEDLEVGDFGWVINGLTEEQERLFNFIRYTPSVFHLYLPNDRAILEQVRIGFTLQ